MAEFTDADVGLAPTKPVEFSDADIGLAPAGSPVTQAIAQPRPIPVDPANTPSFSSDVKTGLNQTSQALNAQSATAANISIDQLNSRISYLEQGQPNHPAEFRMPEQARQQMLTRLIRERDAKTQQFSGSVSALGQDAAAAKDIPVNTGLQEVSKAKTVGEAFSAIGENPWEVTRGMVGQSLPAAIPVIVSTIMGGPLGGLLAGATTGAITGGGNSALKVLNDNQIDTSNPEAVKAALADPAISAQVRKAFAIGAGVDTGVGGVTGAFGGMGFNVGSTPARTIMANAGIQASGQGTAAVAGEGGKQLALDGELTAGPLVMQALGQGIFAPVEGARASWAVAKTRVSQKLGRPATDAEVINDPQTQNDFRAAGVTDEQLITAAEAAGISGPDDPRFAILQDRLARRRIEESLRPEPAATVSPDEFRNTPKGVFSEDIQRRQDEATNRGSVDQQSTTQNGVAAQTARATEEGTINPQATNVVPRQPDTRPIAVQPDGGAYRADEATMQGRNRAQVAQEANTLRLPAPGRAVPTDEEIRVQRIDAERKSRVQQPPGEDPYYVPEGRPAQNPEQFQAQTQAGEAFTLADRQRGRAGADVRDTQVAGRPEGANPQQVYLDDGFPVEIVSRTMMPDARGNMVEVATVRRYDPRTGKPETDAVEYQIPVRQLKSKSYAAEPRMAQDFEARAETGKINAGRDRGKRMDDAQGLDRQTYRQTAPDPDPNASGRYTRPEQPDGPTPFKKWSSYEEAMRDFADRQSRGQTEPPKSGPDYSNAKSSNQAGPKDRDGRFVVDENGHVMSSAQGPIRFADQKQAAKWILNVGQKQSPDQIFEIAVHPTGKGFTARERGRSESPPPGGKAKPEAAPQPETNRPAQPETPRGLEGPRAERAPEPAPRPTPDQSFDEKVRAERDRLWAEDMGRSSRNKASNDRMVESAARENIVRREAAEHVRETEVMGASKDDITDIAQLYRREKGQTPQEAWEDAYAKWVDKGEQEAMRDANLFTQEDTDFDTLKVDSGSDAAKMADVYTQDAQNTAREAKISSDSLDNIPFDEVPGGKRETSRAPDETGRKDAPERGAERPGTRPEAGAGSKDAGRDFATDAGPDGGRQTVVPGAERDTRGANQRRADAPLRGGDEAPPKGGLFDEDSRNQGDIFDAPRKSDRAAGDPRPFDDEAPTEPKKLLTPVERAYAEIQALAKQDREGWTLAQEAKAVGLTEAEASSFMTMGKNRREPTPDQRAKLNKMLDARDKATAKSEAAEADILKKHGVTQKQWDSFQDKMGRLSDDKFRERHDDIVGRGTTFYSNPFLDPAAWKGLAKSLGVHADYFNDLKSRLESIKESWASSGGKKTNALADLGRAAFYSTDGELRAIGTVYKSPTIKKIADMLFAPADMGKGGAVSRSYHEAVEQRTISNLNKMADVLSAFRNDKAILNQIRQLVQNPGNIRRGNPVHDAAAKLTELLDSEFKYLKDAGVDVGKLIGYFPRIVDAEKVLRNPSDFIEAATQQYMKDGIAANRQEAAKLAQAWLASVELGHAGARKDGTDFVMLGGTPNSDFRKERVFGRSIETDKNNPLAKYYLQDPIDVLTLHFQRTARRAEWARRFGDDLQGWKDLKEQIVKEGNVASLKQVVDAIAVSTGTQRAYQSDAARAAIGTLRTWGAIRLLPRATITSLSEVAMPAIRSGNLTRVLGDVVRTAYALAGGMKAERDLAADLGLISNAIGDSILGRRYFAMEPGSKVQQDIMNAYFRRTGLEQFTAATRVMSVAAGQTFIRRLAADVDGNGGRQQSSRAFLRELGIDDADGFAKWLMATNDGKPGLADLKKDTGREAEYRTALQRYNQQSSLNPNASTRPKWSNHPLGSLVFMLQSYAYAFQKQVLNRAATGVMEGVTGKGYSMADRATMLAPAMLLPVLAAIQYGLAGPRDAVFGDPSSKPKTPEQEYMQAISRSGLTGILDPYINMRTGARYDRDAATAVAGPVLGGLFQTIDAAVKFDVKNSDKTNTAERNLTKAMYDATLMPAAAVLGGFLPAPIGAAVIQGASSGAARNAVTSAVAGPKAPERRGPPRPPRPPRPPSPPRP